MADISWRIEDMYYVTRNALLQCRGEKGMTTVQNIKKSYLITTGAHESNAREINDLLLPYK